MYNLEYTVSISSPEIIDAYAFFVFQFLDGFYMADSQVYHMDVVTDASAIRGIVIITEDTQTLQFADGNLCHVRQKIVGDSFGIFADQAALVGTDGIEVTQQNHVPLRICSVQVHQNLFQHPFGPAIRIGAGSFRAFFCDRDLSRIAVNSC